MNRTSKRWRKWKRNRYRRLLKIKRRRMAQLLAKMPDITEAQVDRYNRRAKWCNLLVQYPKQEGCEIIEGSVECPVCEKEVWLMASPCQWTHRDVPKWRRKRRNRKPTWCVDDYWGGIGDCCSGFIASQPDGEVHFYESKTKETKG